MSVFSQLDALPTIVCPGLDGKPCGMMLLGEEDYCFSCGRPNAAQPKAAKPKMQEWHNVANTPCSTDSGNPPSAANEQFTTPSSTSAACAKSPINRSKAKGKSKTAPRPPKGTGERSGTVYMVARPDLAKNKSGPNYCPPMRIGGTKSKNIGFTNLHQELMDALKSKFKNFSETEDPETVAAHFKYMLLKSGANLCLHPKTGKPQSHSNVNKYPLYLRMFMREGSVHFTEEADFTRRNEGMARRVARDYVAKIVVTHSVDKVEYKDLTPEKKESLRNKLTNNYMHGFTDMVECLEKEARDGEVESDVDEEELEYDQETPSSKRARDEDTQAPVSAKRVAVCTQQTDSDMELEPEEADNVAPKSVLDGGLDGAAVPPGFAFNNSVVFIDSDRLYPLIGRDLNTRLLKLGSPEKHGFGLLDDETMNSCLVQLGTIRRSTILVSLGETDAILRGRPMRLAREKFEKSEQIIFTLNLHGNHWVALECNAGVQGLFLGFDSLYSDENKNQMERVANVLNSFLWPRGPDLIYLDHPIHCSAESRRVQQKGTYDCGVFVLHFIRSAVFIEESLWEDQAAKIESVLRDPLLARRKIAAYVRDFASAR